MSEYDKCFDRLYLSEKGYQNRYDDRGNWTTGVIGSGERKGTKFGITAMTYPDLDIQRLTIDQAKAIYYEDFWKHYNIEQYPKVLRFQIFDSYVQHRPREVVKMIQEAVFTKQDGVIGPKTRMAIKNANVHTFLNLFNGARIRLYADLGTFDLNGRGWMRRMADNLKYAAEDYV